MKWARTAAAASFILLLAFSAFAHDGNDHVRGIVTAVGENSITLDTTDKKTVTVIVDASTKFERAGVKAAMQDLKVGERAVIDVNRKNGKIYGSLVRFGSPKKVSGK